MTFVNPIFLWSMLGISIPLAIHFLSRKDGVIIRLGSLRHVRETSTQHFKGIKLNEILLLILRCLLIIILSLLLAGLSMNRTSSLKWVLVEKGIEKNKQVKSWIDSLEKQGYEEHWFTEDFPTIDEEATSSVSYSTLVSELDKKGVGDAILFYYQKAENFKGKRIALPSTFRAMSVEPGDKKFLLRAIPWHDSVYLRIGNSSAKGTTYEDQLTRLAPDTVSVSPPHQIKIVVHFDQVHQSDKKILIASLRAAEELTKSTFIILEKDAAHIDTDSADWGFWLGQQQVNKNVINTVVLQPAPSTHLVERTERNNWQITERLNEDVAIHRNLTLSLASLLTFNDSLMNIASAHDHRMLPDSMAWASTPTNEKKAELSQQSLASYLIIAFIFVLTAERLLAWKRGQ